MNSLVIIGAGGVGRFVRQLVREINSEDEEWNLLGFLDENSDLYGVKIDGLRVLGGISWLKDHPSAFAVIAIATPRSKERISTLLKSLGHENFATLVHPRSWLADDARIGIGSIIYPGVSVNVGSRLGRHVIVNMNCAIGHDTIVHDFSSLAPGVKLGGATVIQKGCELGVGSATIQSVTIGEWSVVGAGAVVIRDISDGTVAVGVPAHPMTSKPGNRG